MEQPEIQILKSDETGLARAADLLKQGCLVGFATETVYGLAADARSGTAVAGIFAAKKRPDFNPLIVHVPDQVAAQAHVEWSDMAETLASAFWPGPLSLVLPLCAGHGIAPLVTAGLDTLAIRAPAHEGAQRLLRAFGGPLAAPSANPSGRISPTSARHVLDGLRRRIAAVLDDGDCAVGVESTIVGLAGGAPELLRPGGVAVEEIEAVLGQALRRRSAGAALTAPGQMLSHYAPRVALRLNAERAEADEVLLGFGPGKSALNLSATSDLNEAAANLFAHLHALDQQGCPIAVMAIPDHGLGRAINDRLQRAAAPRGS